MGRGAAARHPVGVRRAGRAAPDPAGAAGPAAAARDQPGQRDEDAGPELGIRRRDALAERLDDRRALVAEDDRALPLPVAVADVEVRVADAGRRHPDADLARTGRVELERLDPDGHAGAVDDRGADRGRPGDSGTASGSHVGAATRAGPRAEPAGPAPRDVLGNRETVDERRRSSIRGACSDRSVMALEGPPVPGRPEGDRR